MIQWSKGPGSADKVCPAEHDLFLLSEAKVDVFISSVERILWKRKTSLESIALILAVYEDKCSQARPHIVTGTKMNAKLCVVIRNANMTFDTLITINHSMLADSGIRDTKLYRA